MFRSIWALITITTMFAACNGDNNLTKLSDKEYVNRAVNNNFPSPDSIQLKDASGKIISKEIMIGLYESGGFTSDFYTNPEGKIVEAVVRKSTPEDQILEAQINEKLNAGPPVTISTIECDKVAVLLDEAYRRDQEIRKEGANYDPMVDHKNLELVVSIDDSCGLPSGPDYSKEINIIWLIIQHNKAEFRRRYFEYFKTQRDAGAIDAGSVALMRDRILMDGGKPQIYGSQILDGQLYNLREPSKVDQRRAEVGLGPLSEYLDRFGIEFDVAQD